MPSFSKDCINIYFILFTKLICKSCCDLLNSSCYCHIIINKTYFFHSEYSPSCIVNNEYRFTKKAPIELTIDAQTIISLICLQILHHFYNINTISFTCSPSISIWIFFLTKPFHIRSASSCNQ